MYQKLPDIPQIIKTSLDGPYQKQVEEAMIRGDQIEIKHLILDQALEVSLIQKIEQVKNVILVQATVLKHQNLDSLLIKCKVELA